MLCGMSWIAGMISYSNGRIVRPFEVPSKRVQGTILLGSTQNYSVGFEEKAAHPGMVGISAAAAETSVHRRPLRRSSRLAARFGPPTFRTLVKIEIHPPPAPTRAMRPVAAAAQLLPPPQTMPHVSRALRHAKVFVVMVTGDDLRAVQRGSRNGCRNGCYTLEGSAGKYGIMILHFEKLQKAPDTS